jgi:hypothetical protein
MRGDHWLSILLLIGLVCAGCSVQSANGAVFRIWVDREDSTVQVAARPSEVAIEVRSESGIGGAEVQLLAGAFPSKLIFNMYLSGLERFQLTYGHVSVTVVDSSSGDQGIRQYVSLPGGADDGTEIDSDSPMWIDVERLPECDTEDDRPVSCYRLHAPDDMLLLQPEQLRLSWIDFYR